MITRRDLASPWRNYLSTDHLSMVTTHTGTGPSFGRSVWADWVQSDRSPRLVYVRDRQSGKHWTINGVGTRRQPAKWRCTHGFGYTTIRSTTSAIAGDLTYFLPLDEPVEIWKVGLRNDSDTPRQLSVFPTVVWCLGGRHESIYDDMHFENNTILAEAYHWPFINARNSYPEYNRNWDRVAFMTADSPVKGFDGVLSEVTADGGPVGSALMSKGKCTNSLRRGVPSCGILQVDVSLAPREHRDLVILVGAAKDKRDVRRIVKKYAAPQKAGAALAKVKDWWDKYLDEMTVHTPDRDITTFANGWNRYAMYIRYYHRFGYRDTAQDMGCFIPIDRERFHARTKLLLEAQFRRGITYHDVADLGFPQHLTINSDPPAWLPWLIGSYVKETGDFAYLRKKFSYHDGTAGSVYDHVVRALDYYARESGRHGLPYIKCGDWNDCLMGSHANGVSVWLAHFLYIGLTDATEMAQRIGKPDDAERFRKRKHALKKTINDNCWDGGWYVRAFDDDGEPIGSRRNRQGKIFLNAQSWAVIAGIAGPDRALKAMRSVEKRMDTPVGIPLVTPAYSKVEPRVGLLSRIAPGQHHLGVWNHANTWAIIAECMVGRPDRALDLYRRIFPPYLSHKWDQHTAEPYVHSSYTNTPISGETGKTGVGWNTGTVCWIHRALFEGFGGVRPEWDGLRIDPSLPREWKDMSLKRRYRNNVFHITIHDPHGVSRGVKRVTVDGEEIEGNLVTAVAEKKERRVRIELG